MSIGVCWSSVEATFSATACSCGETKPSPLFLPVALRQKRLKRFRLGLSPADAAAAPSGEGGAERVGLVERLRAVFEDAGEDGLDVSLPLVGLLLDFDANPSVSSIHPVKGDV